jgi:integrase/recombinase XerD
VEWYRCSFRAFEPYLTTVGDQNELRLAVKKAVMKMCEAGKLSPTSINDYARCINAFLKWMTDEGHISERIRIPKIKTPEKLPSLLSEQQVTALIQYKPKNRIERRIHMMVLVVLDTGVRVDEVSHIRKQDVDMDNLLLTVNKGKGGKQRVVPFSLALRRALFRFMKTEPHTQSEFVFSTRSGLPQTYRNAHRQLKLIGTKVGAPGVRFHLLRHQWATHYLRSGGSVALLRRQLGHASLETVLFYEHLASSDLREVHERFSLLASRAI